MLIVLQWVLGIGGLALLAFGLLWDRPGWRGRAALRCRKCWFDLTGTPGVGDASRETPIVCGECGKPHRSRRQMRRTKRYRWPLVLALLVWIGAYTAGVWEETRQHGWVRAVPSWALVGAHLVFDDPDTPYYEAINYRTKKPSPVAEQLLAELRRRIPYRTFGQPDTSINRLLAWPIGQYEIGMLDEVTRGNATTRYLFDLWNHDLLTAGQIETIRERAARAHVVYRDRWPAGVPLRVIVRQPWRDSRFWASWLLGPLKRPPEISDDETRDWYISEMYERMPYLEAEITMQSNGNPVTESFRVSFLEDNRSALVTPAATVPWRDTSITIGEPTGLLSASLNLPADLDERPVYPAKVGRLGGITYVNTYGYEVVETIDDAITPVADPAIDALVLQALSFTLAYDSAIDQAWHADNATLDCGVVVELDGPLKSRLPEMTIAFRGSFVHNGEAIASFRMTRGTRRAGFGWAAILPASAYFEGNTVRVSKLIESGAPWSLVIESDAELALTEFDFNHYWKGRFEIPSSRVVVRKGGIWFGP